jgi:predicted nucleotidyltransferase
MSPQEEIRAKLPQIEEICRRYHVRELSLFGSALRSDFRRKVTMTSWLNSSRDASIGLFKFGRMVLDLEALFHRKIDLVFKSGLKPLIRDNVISHAQVPYAQH